MSNRTDYMGFGLKCKKPDVCKVLHVCCGKQTLPPVFDDWEEVRLDIDSNVNPDILGDVSSMHTVSDAMFHCVWFEAGLEHLCEYDVTMALLECYRVLAAGGVLFVSVPNLEAVATAILKGHLDDQMLDSENVRCTWNDVIYGHQDSVRTNGHMSHRFGFTPDTLEKRLKSAGFFDIRTTTHNEMIDALAWKGLFQ